MAAELKLAFVGSEEDEAEVPADFEAVVLQDLRLSLRDLVEDELLLSFPLVPMHAVGSSACRPAVKVLSEEEVAMLPEDPVVESPKANPFAGLKNMLKRED